MTQSKQLARPRRLYSKPGSHIRDTGMLGLIRSDAVSFIWRCAKDECGRVDHTMSDLWSWQGDKER